MRLQSFRPSGELRVLGKEYYYYYNNSNDDDDDR